jgi:hypothetical protein
LVVLAGEAVAEVLVLRKIFSTEPQQFMLVLRDSMKLQNTEFGAEREVRVKLRVARVSDAEIDRLFEAAKFQP